MKKTILVINDILNERKIPKHKLAMDLGISYPAVDRMCKNKNNTVDLTILQKIATYLNLKVSDLFGEIELSDNTGYPVLEVA